jgi:carbohydrate binding protein with CBM30 domain
MVNVPTGDPAKKSRLKVDGRLSVVFSRELMTPLRPILFCQVIFAMAVIDGAAAQPVAVSDFNGEPMTQQGGAITARQRIPSAVKWSLDDAEPHGSSGKSLRIEFIRLRGGEECALLLRIPGVDLTGCDSLTFWVKGSEGGEIFDIGLSDAETDRQEKLPATVVPIEKSLPGGLTADWQKAVIPISELSAGQSGRQSGSIVIAFNRITKYSVIHIDDVQFESSAKAP